MIRGIFSEKLFEQPFVVLRPDAGVWFMVDPQFQEDIDDFNEFVTDWDRPVKMS